MRGLIALIVALNFQMPSPAGKTKQPVITNSYSRENGDARQQKQKRKLPTPTAATSPNNAKEKRSNADDHQAEPAHGVYMVNMATPERPPQDTPLFVWYLIATVVGVAVNAVILYFIWKQTNINGKQARISLIAANAAKSSADTARNSLEIYKKQMRPWLIETLSAPGNDEPWPHLLFVYFKTISGSVSAAFRSVGGDKANSGLLAVNVGLLPYEIQDDGVYSNADDSGNEIPHKQRGILWWSFWRRHIDHINPVGRFCLVIISIGAFFFSVIRAGRSRRGWQFALLFLLSCISIFPAVAIGYYWLFRLSGW